MTLSGSVKVIVVLFCDRFSANRKLARELGGRVILQWCRAHQRRSFIDCAAGHVRLRRWCQRWIERIAEIYRLNEARLEHYDRAHPLERQAPAFDAAQAELKKTVDALFADAKTELAGMTDRAQGQTAALASQPPRGAVRLRRGACPGTGPSATAPPPCSSRPSSRPRDTLAPSTGRRAGPASGPPRAGAATTSARNEPGRRRTSGSDPSEKIGNATSTGRIPPSWDRFRWSCQQADNHLLIPRDPNAYQPGSRTGSPGSLAGLVRRVPWAGSDV